MRNNGLRVSRSHVSGLGLFAERDFGKNETICEYTGPRVPNEDRLVNRYSFEINTKWMIGSRPAGAVIYKEHP